jgi:Spy/CpxP family protein refolding chaperone
MALFGLRQLGLTEQQREQVRSIMQSHRQELQALAERTRTAREMLRDAQQADTVDEIAIRDASRQLAEVQADSAVLHARIRQEALGVLTQEQRERAEALRTQREQRLEERRQRLQGRLRQRPGGQAL